MRRAISPGSNVAAHGPAAAVLLVGLVALAATSCGGGQEVGTGDVPVVDRLGACDDDDPAGLDAPPLSYWLEPGRLAWVESSQLRTTGGGDVARVDVVDGRPLAGRGEIPSSDLALGRSRAEDLALVEGGDVAVRGYIVGIDAGAPDGPEVKLVAAELADGDVRFLGECAERLATAPLDAGAAAAGVPPADALRGALGDPGGAAGAALLDGGGAGAPAPVAWTARPAGERFLDPAETPAEVYDELVGVRIDVVLEPGATSAGYLCSRSSIAWGEECIVLDPSADGAWSMSVHAPVGEGAELVVVPEPHPARGGRTVARLSTEDLAGGQQIEVRLAGGGAEVVVG